MPGSQRERASLAITLALTATARAAFPAERSPCAIECPLTVDIDQTPTGQRFDDRTAHGLLPRLQASAA